MNVARRSVVVPLILRGKKGWAKLAFVIVTGCVCVSSLARHRGYLRMETRSGRSCLLRETQPVETTLPLALRKAQR